MSAGGRTSLVGVALLLLAVLAWVALLATGAAAFALVMGGAFVVGLVLALVGVLMLAFRRREPVPRD